MGLEISEEFRPITPVKTVSGSARTTSNEKVFDLEEKVVAAEVPLSCSEEDIDNLGEECRTPRSPAAADILKQPLVCPPAPKKSRPLKRKFPPVPSQGFFQVPDDLESIFLPLSEPSSKKIRAN